jgi:hypothetical protein
MTLGVQLNAVRPHHQAAEVELSPPSMGLALVASRRRVISELFRTPREISESGPQEDTESFNAWRAR